MSVPLAGGLAAAGIVLMLAGAHTAILRARYWLSERQDE